MVSIACNTTNLEFYPFDTYECDFHIFNMDGNYLDKVVLVPACNCSKDKTDKEFSYHFSEIKSKKYFGKYETIVMKTHVKRIRKTKVVAYYAVTSLVAFLSLISFFIEKENVPGRLGALVTLYLLLVNTYKSFPVPNKIGFGYIDQWFILIQTPILIAIMEYGLVLIWRKYSNIVGMELWHKNGLKFIDLGTFAFVLIYLISAVGYAANKFANE